MRRQASFSISISVLPLLSEVNPKPAGNNETRTADLTGDDTYDC